MAMVASSLQQCIIPKYPFLLHKSQFICRAQNSSLPFPRTGASLAVAHEPESSPHPNDDLELDLFSCPICYESLIRKVPQGLNLAAIYRSGFKCKTCNQSYSSKDMYLDLTITAGSKQCNGAQQVGTELFQSPLVSFLFERGWRQNFDLRCFPGPGEVFKMAQEYFKPAAGGLLVDVSCGSGLFSRKFAESACRNCLYIKKRMGIFVGTTFLRPVFADSFVPAILRPSIQTLLQIPKYLTEEEIEDLCTSCGLINYTSKTQQSFSIFSALKA